MRFWKFYIGKKKRNHQVPTLKDFVEYKHCLCFFCVSSNGHIEIKLNDDESQEDEIEADKLFESYKKEHRIVHYYNYRAGLYKLYNSNGRTIQQEIVKKTNHPFDNNSFIATINYFGSTYENNQLPPMFFSFIFKLLKDGVLGYGYDDLKATSFRNIMWNRYNFKTEGRSSFSKYKPQGKYPNWYYNENQFKKDRSLKVEKVLDFAKKFVLVYDNFRFQSKANIKDETIETAEDTTEFL